MNETLQQLIENGREVCNLVDAERWFGEVEEYIRLVYGEENLKEFVSRTEGGNSEELFLAKSKAIGYLQALRDNSVIKLSDAQRKRENELNGVVAATKRVFVVHGHNNEAKETVARFVEKLGLEAVILHERPNAGKTVIEKFECHSDVAFAVVLLTPDDVGAVDTPDPKLRPRARQNVVFELGYFVAHLGRKRVCAIYKGDVELPSDYDGILYVPFDAEGAWKSKLAQELVGAGIPIELNGLLQA